MKKLWLIILCITLFVWNGRARERITRGAGKSHSVRLVAGKVENAVYSWQVTPASGTSTDVETVTGSTATIVWDGPPGLYTLSVKVVDGNGCASEQISREVEIIAPGDLAFATTTPSTTVCSDLSGGIEGSLPEHTQSLFRVVYSGGTNLASVKCTIENPDGLFIGLDGNVLPVQSSPEVTVENDAPDQTIDVAINDTWKNEGESNVQFTVTLVSAKTTDNAEIPAGPETDITRIISVLPKPVIGF